MKKVIFGIFAHPDDEAFGPSATLVMEKAHGAEIHLICATAGESGMNPDNLPHLAEVRLEEWRLAGKLIGANSMHHLGYKDGTLSNNNYHEIASRIDDIVRHIIHGRQDIEIEFMTIDLNGVTGHIDHICIARIACYVYCNLKAHDRRVGRMRLACISRDEAPEANCQWLFMEAGHEKSEIAETVDAREHLATVREIMRAHHTQRHDGEAHLEKLGDAIAINHFLELMY
jgi:LmbE family N-acetylglucosaminyl deacetylase